MALTGKQRRRLRALGHHLKPVVIVGQDGVTPGVLAAVDQALFDHELVKVKLGDCPEEKDEAAERLAGGSGAELAQLLGRTVLLYKAREDNPEIVLDAPKEKPKTETKEKKKS